MDYYRTRFTEKLKEALAAVFPIIRFGCCINPFTLHSLQPVYSAKELDGDKRRHGNHGDDTKRILHDISSDTLAGPHSKGK